jgi:hypothetical protein
MKWKPAYKELLRGKKLRCLGWSDLAGHIEISPRSEFILLRRFRRGGWEEKKWQPYHLDFARTDWYVVESMYESRRGCGCGGL